VLGAAGISVSPDALTPHVYLPGRQGSLQAELVATTRRYGRIPYVLQPRLQDLLTEVSAGTPVLVMQNLGLRMLPQWHYAVVIGYDAPADSLILRSGTDERLRMNRVRFQGAWARADNWAMVAVLPAHPPPTATSIAWLRSASDLDEVGKPELAMQAYTAATRRWHQDALSWQALANAHYAQGNLTGAELALRRALQLAPSAAAHNNLAHVLQERGCLAEASAEIELAEKLADAATLGPVLARTRAAIEENTGRQSGHCTGRQRAR
jgi:hypothetical protein